MAKGDMPVLIGVGQSVSHWEADDGPAAAPSPLSLAADAARAALSDTGAAGLAGAIDTLTFVRIFEDSVPGAPHPHGHNTNLPGTLARDIGADPRHLVYASVGGQSPQSLVNEFASAIHAGKAETVLIAGSEAIGASKTARRAGLKLDWTDSDAREVEDRGLGEMLLSRHEIKHGLVSPPYFYALFENAIAARHGRTRSQQREAMSQLFERFSKVAEQNPYAQFPVHRSAEWLAEPSAENYELADPFLKWHVAQDAVNQGAAVLLVSECKADELGVPVGKRVYLHGGGEAGDVHISERERIDGSWAMKIAVDRALKAAGKHQSDMALFDLYSCFPCAVTSACEALGIDPLGEVRPLTLTGGLPFFGGPGNNYSLHGIAEMVNAMRERPDSFGLVLANGGWMTKEAAGVYSAQRPAGFTPAEPAAKPELSVAIASAPSSGTIESFTVIHGRAGPERGILSCRTDDGARFCALAAPALLARLREEDSPVGLTVAISEDGEVNTAFLGD